MGVTLLDDRQRAAINTAAGRKAFAFWTGLYREGLLPREVLSQGQRRAIELYQSGELALLASGAEFLRSIQTNAPGVAAVTTPEPPLTGSDGTANVALMTLAVPRQSDQAQDALELALFLTNGSNQARFAREARVLPSSLEALAAVRAELEAERPSDAGEAQIREARLLSADTLQRARVLVPATPGVKRLTSSTPSFNGPCWARSAVTKRSGKRSCSGIVTQAPDGPETSCNTPLQFLKEAKTCSWFGSQTPMRSHRTVRLQFFPSGVYARRPIPPIRWRWASPGSS